MSNYDPSAAARNAAAIARSGAGIDQGLRAHMLGVYNYMALGLGVTGVIAYFAFKLGTAELADGRLALNGLGQALYVSPLRWLFAFAPLGIVMYLSARINSMSVASARNAFFVFAAAMGLFGLIIAGVVNLFLQSNGMQWALSVLSIVIFAGLTAWNTQSIKNQYYAGYGEEARQKASIFGALSLYLDFINIFQALLMLTGGRRN